MPKQEQERIRNFCIIAHIDHGKSTLADRLLEVTGTLAERERVDQYLDRMDLERERGITIKAQSVRMKYAADDGLTYQLNLIDTPGHVDFSYEVSRSLSACEGALLIVDASQGVEAQTLANYDLAQEAGLEIIPVLNKIDLPGADIDRVKRQLEELLGIAAVEAIPISAKEGRNIHEVLEAVVTLLPPPTGSASEPLRALIFDSWFDPYQGAVLLCRVLDGVIRKAKRIRLMGVGMDYEVARVGVFSPDAIETESLGPGEVGFLTAGVKEISHARIGDTVTGGERPAGSPLRGFKITKPMVFAGLYPADTAGYVALRDALEKLRLNDPAINYEPESSEALGFGFRCGFLGLLHLEIVQERLEREYGLDLITTAPTVSYRVSDRNGNTRMIENPTRFPSAGDIEQIEEPIIRARLHVPSEYLGGVLAICDEKRGVQEEMTYPSTGRVILTYDLPLNEIVVDFHDRLKSLTRGYGSMDYDILEYREADLVRLDILVNGAPVDALSSVVHREKAYIHGRELVSKLRKTIPRQLFEVVLQAAIGSRVIAREEVKALRKNVTAKCYGGDVTRKRKLLEKQKEGKKRMKRVGRVDIPQEAFMAVLRLGKEQPGKS